EKNNNRIFKLCFRVKFKGSYFRKFKYCCWNRLWKQSTKFSSSNEFVKFCNCRCKFKGNCQWSNKCNYYWRIYRWQWLKHRNNRKHKYCKNIFKRGFKSYSKNKSECFRISSGIVYY